MTEAETEPATVPDPRVEEAIALMEEFAQRTGLTSPHPPRRYLWTDAFAVCNYLGLARRTGDERYGELALRLVDQVHHTLGRHRDDDPRSGWISSLPEDDGEQHPTRGGLRIGKPLPERTPGDPFDERLEWDRDGQYFHYLTRWMHALDQASRWTGRPLFNAWARELAAGSFDAFSYVTGADRPRRMVWKMSIDLTRPLVPSMGQHDPLDGYVTVLELRATAAALAETATGPALEEEARAFAAMVEGGGLATSDPLGMGGLLVDAFRVAQLMHQGALTDEHLLGRLLADALAGLRRYAQSGELRASHRYRLAFRELGLAVGLDAVRRMQQADAQRRPALGSQVRAQLDALMRYVPLGEDIEAFWRSPVHRSADTWSEHRDINEVMLATRLAPEGFLVFESSDGGL